MTPFVLPAFIALALIALIVHTLRVVAVDGYGRRPTRTDYDTRTPA